MVDCSKELTVLEEGEICVQHCARPKDTFRHIKRTFRNLTGLHVFHHKFATGKVLRRVFKTFPYLKSLSLNCNNKFSWDMLDELNSFQLGNICKL